MSVWTPNAQKLATRAFRACEKVLYSRGGKAKRVRFEGRNQLGNVESKGNATVIRSREDHVEWKGLRLSAVIDRRDPVIIHGLSSRVKYVRLVLRKIGGRHRFFVQLICEGLPYRKEKNRPEEGVVGLYIGPSTVAVAGDEKAFLTHFCSELEPKERKIRILGRKLDRQRRAGNPHDYNSDGTAKPGAKRWEKSRRYLHTRDEPAKTHRRLAGHRRTLHGKLVNVILGTGDTFLPERLS